MKGIEKITARIAADAASEISAVRAESDSRCSEIRAEYDKKAQESYDALMRTGLREAEQHASRIERTAQLDAKKALLGLRQEMVSEAFKLAEQKLVNMPEEEYLAFLTRQALEAVTTGCEELVMNAADREKIGAKLAAGVNAALKEKGSAADVTVAEATREMLGGFILRQDNVEVNCHLDLMLEMIRGEVAAQAAKVLVGE